MSNDYRLRPGLYIAENDDSIWDSYRIKMQVKETDKAYTFRLVDFQSRYSAGHIETLFKAAKKVTIRKDKGGHAICKWSEEDFTFYPYQAGIPYYFKLAEEER